MNHHDPLTRTKRLRALLRLAEANRDGAPGESDASASGLPRRVFHAEAIHDDVLNALAADGWVEAARNSNRRVSGNRPQAHTARQISKQNSDLVLTAPAAALLDRWLEGGTSFALPTSVDGQERLPQTSQSPGGEKAPYRPATSETPAESPFPGNVAAHDTPLVVPRPTWDRRGGDLCWRGELLLHLTDHASVGASILDEFQRFGWIWVICSPLATEDIGDKTGSQRHAIYELNQRQGNRLMIHFASLHGERICWCPAEWARRT